MGMSKVWTEVQKRKSKSFCGAAPQTFAEYIVRHPEYTQTYLRQINETIHIALPDAVPKLSWSMPTYWKKRNLIQFAAAKKHIGLYPLLSRLHRFPGPVHGISDRTLFHPGTEADLCVSSQPL